VRRDDDHGVRRLDTPATLPLNSTPMNRILAATTTTTTTPHNVRSRTVAR
jgi:hypothetical protein